MIPTTDLPEKQNCRDSEKISGCQGWGGGEGGINSWRTKDFQGGENGLCDVVMMGPSQCTAVQAHTYRAKSEP